MTTGTSVASRDEDTIIIAAKEEGFDNVFIGEHCWYPIRLGDKKLSSLKWIAVYQTSPIRAITHFARITGIEYYKETGRYKINFETPEELRAPISLGDSSTLTMQGQRYTQISKLLAAKSISDLIPWK